MGITTRRLNAPLARGVSFSQELMASLRASAQGTAGQTVNKATAITIPAIGAAVNFRATHIAMLELGTWRTDTDTIPERVTTAWQSKLLSGTPNSIQSWFDFWETVESSLSYRSNAYVWKSRSGARVSALTALHPDQVIPRFLDGRLKYIVVFSDDYPCPPDVEYRAGTITVDSSVIWHVKGRGGMGRLVAPSPIEIYAQSIGCALAKQEYESALYENGTLGGLVASFPREVSQKDAADWKKMWNDSNAGAHKAGTTKVIGGGASIQQIGMSQRDAQFVESVDMSILDVCNIFGVPAYFLNQSEKSSRAVLPEHEEARWVNHYLAPELRRIEQSMYADTGLFGPGSAIFPRFDSGNLIHPDSATKASILATKVQTGQWTPDEARSADGMPPLPDGIGEVPIFVPVGGSPAGMPLKQGDEND